VESVPAVLVCVAAALGVDGDGLDNLLDGDLVHDTVAGVGGGGDDAIILGGSILGVGGSGDGRRGSGLVRSSGRCGLGLRCGSSSSASLDSEDGDTATERVGRALGAGRCVAEGRHRGNGRDAGLDGLLVALVTALEGSSVLRAVLDGNVSAETVRGTGAVVGVEGLGHGLDLALALFGLGLEATSKDGAVLNTTRGVGAGADGGLESVDIPTVDEIGVVSVAYIAVS
jgi:hypothetical protein